MGSSKIYKRMLELPANDFEPAFALPQVTVLVPAYNLERYIEDAVKSVALQDYEGPFAIISLDDGSTDNTLMVLQKLEKKYPHLSIHTQPNSGRAHTRNRLLQLATTEYVAWLDGDDMASPDWLRDQMSMILQNRDRGAVSGQGYALTATGMPIGPIDHPLSHKEIEKRHLCGQPNAFFQSAVVVRRSIAIAIGGYDIAFAVAEDYDFWLRLSEKFVLANANRLHLYYRVHATSANSTLSEQQASQGVQVLNRARARRGLPPIEAIAAVNAGKRRSDWQRRIYLINIALKSGNPLSAISLSAQAILRHPTSVLVWIFACVACLDTIICFGNRSHGFRPGAVAKIGKLPAVASYRLFAMVYRNAFRRQSRIRHKDKS